MPSILIVDDEKKIRDVIREYAEFEGYHVDEAADGMAAVEKCSGGSYDVIIMDAMMPRLDGFSACKEILARMDVPILMLSARGEEYDKLFGFEVGVQDYVVKPFSPKELMARVRVLAGRSQSNTKTQQDATLSFGGLSIDTAGRDVYVDGAKVQLTPKEYELLEYMARNANVALSREQLLSEVWGFDYFGDDRTIDTHIKMLRNSLGGYRGHIVTLRGVGYKFEA